METCCSPWKHDSYHLLPSLLRS